MLTEIKTFTLVLTYCIVLYDLIIINMAVFQLTRSDFYHSTALKFASAFNINKHGDCPFFIYTFRYGYYFITKFHSIYFMILFSCEAVMNRKSSSHFSIFLVSYQGFSNFFRRKYSWISCHIMLQRKYWNIKPFMIFIKKCF